MASSKFYHEEVLVPEALIALSRSQPDVVFCNLRYSQRPAPTSQEDIIHRMCGLGIMHPSVEQFLRRVTHPTTVVIVYQGYGTDISTVVRRLPPITCWTDEGLPRLDFEKPANWNHCPNFWGTFILAIAQVNTQETDVIDDPFATRFMSTVDSFGVPSIPTLVT